VLTSTLGKVDFYNALNVFESSTPWCEYVSLNFLVEQTKKFRLLAHVLDMVRMRSTSFATTCPWMTRNERLVDR
jgi:hypothetical protein